MDRFRRLFNDDEQPQTGDTESQRNGIMSQIDEATTLSWETRIYCFIFLFALGVVVSLIVRFV